MRHLRNRSAHRILGSLGGGGLLLGGVLGIGDGFLSEPWWCRALLAQANRIARRGGTLRLAVDARRLASSTVSRTMLDAVDLALHHGAAPVVYEHRARVLLAA